MLAAPLRHTVRLLRQSAVRLRKPRCFNELHDLRAVLNVVFREIELLGDFLVGLPLRAKRDIAAMSWSRNHDISIATMLTSGRLLVVVIAVRLLGELAGERRAVYLATDRACKLADDAEAFVRPAIARRLAVAFAG